MSDRSVEARDISSSAVVTGDGNTVTLTFGNSGVRLPLLRKQFPPPERRRRQAAGEPPRELDLLVPETGTLPMIGRQDLLAELRGWLDDDFDISVHALIGPAGSGKTRLAIGLSQAIDSDPGGKGAWIAGFLSAGDLTPVVNTLATRSFAWERRTLLVIDNAAQCQQVLARWLDRLSSQQKLDAKLRMLLLDREAPEGFGWWHELTASGPPARRDLFYALRPRRLPDLPDLEERRELISSALQAARALRASAPDDPHIPAKDEDPDFDRRLAEPQFGNPLALVMAGVIMLDRGPQGAMALRHLEAARQLGRRELDRMAGLAESRRVSGDAVRHIVAFNGLVGGIPVTRLRQMAHRSADLDAVLTLLEQELPPSNEVADTSREPRLATIRPDLIGEAAIIGAFTGRASSEAEAEKVVSRAYRLSLEEAARVLVGLVQDFGYPLEDESATSEERALARRVINWLVSLMREVQDPEQMLPLVYALPVQTTILREPAADLTQRLVTHFRQQAASKSGGWNTVAALLNNLAFRLSALGRHEGALAAAEEAVRHYRARAAVRPDAFLPDLAMSLSNLGNVLTALGRHEEALAAAEEAVRLRRALNAFTPDLAASLNNLGIRLSDLGRHEEALTAAEEAVRHYRALAAARPDAFIPDLAMSLNNLANRLSDLGRREKALAAAEEAVRHYRALAAARPDAFIPDLAMSLNNLANRLSALGRREAALAAAEEAVRHCHALAAARPDAFTPNMAASLNTLANTLSDLGRREDALAAADEAVRHYSALAAARPDAFTPDLARSLNNLALMLSALRRHEDALNAADEAVRLRRPLAAARPDVFRVDLARSLGVLGGLYGETGKSDSGIATLAEGVRLLTPIFVAVPAAVADMMEWLVQGYLTQCEAAGREPDAEMLGPVIAEFERLKATEEKQ